MIIIACIIVYLICGALVGGYTRNRVMDASVKKKYDELEKQWSGSLYRPRGWSEFSEKQKIETVLEKVDPLDSNTAMVLSFFFWPLATIYFGLHFIAKFAVPPSKTEKYLKELDAATTKAKELKDTHAQILREYREMNIDTSELEGIMQKEKETTIAELKRVKAKNPFS